jgi:ketosteroid isomerase-like protein
MFGGNIMTTSDPRAAKIIALDEQRRAAMVAADFAVLDRLLADDLIHVHAGGNVDTKQQYFQLIETLCEFTAIERGPMVVRFYGDTAILTGTMHHTVLIRPTGAVCTMAAFGTQVWALHGDSWRQVLYQATEIAAH